MNIPMILDGTSTILKWEKLNHQIVTSHHFGISLRVGADLMCIVDDLLSHPEKLEQMKNNLRAFKKNDGGQEVLHQIEIMLAAS
jgi:UDP-N-acetylglucosamine:LPS N-acetylglucosamine transferase